MGAEAIKDLLAQIDVKELVEDLRAKMKEETSQQKKLKYSKRLKVANSFLRSGNNPQWMILDVIPVDSARAAASCASRRRTLCDERSQRSLSPRHQSQQSV
jgi:DNA-directed RNA polymerase subunit beta'